MGATGRQASPTYQFGPFRLVVAEQLLLRDGLAVPLTPKVFDVLRVLVQNSGHLVEKAELLKEVWPDSFVEEANLNRNVSILRKALGEDASGPRYIETVPTRGYRFVAPVTACLEQEATAGADVALLQKTPASRWRKNKTAQRAAGVAAFGLLVLVIILNVSSDRPQTHAQTGLAPVHRQVTFRGKEGLPTISPDGQHLAFVSIETPERKVVVQALEGGNPLVVFSAPEAGRLRWSPDGSELMFWARGRGKDGVFVVPYLGGTPNKVAQGPFLACWSPDGSTIVFPRFLSGKIVFLNRRSGEQRVVALKAGPQWIQELDWSPSTGLLLFVTRDDHGRSAVWRMRPDGSDQRRVLQQDAEITSARWAPSGDAIYYFHRADQTASLYRVPVQPGEKESQPAASLLMTGLETDGSFALSADGTRLVYARAPYSSNLWMVGTKSEKGEAIETTELTRGTSLIERPRVSPDGNSIVFNIGREPLANLYTIPIDGGSPKQLTFLNAFSVEGVWSADGQWVAFASNQNGPRRVWIVSAHGGTPRALSSGDMSDSFELTWAPGSRILYQQTGNRNYRALDPTTREERSLIVDESVGWMFAPAVSPDGERIAVAWNRPPTPGIWVIDRRDSSQRRVYKTSIYPIGWSADGTSVYAVDAKAAAYRGLPSRLGETLGEAKILKVPVNGGEASTVLTLPFEEIGGVSMTLDGRKFVCAVYSSRSDVWVVENFDVAAKPRDSRQ